MLIFDKTQNLLVMENLKQKSAESMREAGNRALPMVKIFMRSVNFGGPLNLHIAPSSGHIFTLSNTLVYFSCLLSQHYIQYIISPVGQHVYPSAYTILT